MKNQRNKLIRQEKAQEQTVLQKSFHQGESIEFSTAEEAIRFDASHTEVPPSVVERLRDSVSNEPPPNRPWWRRLFAK